MTRLLIADDHPLVLGGVQGLFAGTEFEVVSLQADGDGAWSFIQSGGCDIAIVDLHMPGRSGLDILHEVRAAGLTVKIVLITAAISDPDLMAAMNAQVDGLVLKETAASLLVTCLRSVRDGTPWLDRVVMTRALKVLTHPGGGPDSARLTPRESDVARLVGLGLRNKEIAARLGLAEGTVKMHLHNVYEKLAIGTRTELAIHARDTGLA